MRRRFNPGLAVVVLFAALTVLMRIAWIAHTLSASPLELLNGNIFYPEKRTLAVIVHGALLAPDQFGAIMAALLARPDVRAIARYEERTGADVVFRLSR